MSSSPSSAAAVSAAVLPPALLVVAALFALLGIGFAVASWRALRRGRLFSCSARALTTLLFSALGALCFVLMGATQGYRALTREELACEVRVEPVGRQAFLAHFSFPDGRREVHALAGDQLYVDAHILKWKPWVNILGLHTAYELDRVAGRYTSLDDERERPRTVASLAPARRFDLFDLRRKHDRLGLLVDAEYGSATFIDVQSSATFEVRVSTTGLLVRPKLDGR
jgi:hypothetical protein